MAKVKIVSDRLNTFFTNNRIATGTAAPTSGTWKVGDIVISTTQSGVIGWVCTIAGTPGTWETIQSKEDLSAAFAAKTHTHNYAGSSSAGGAATSALACTGNSATATKATQDSAGQQINKTYIKGLSVSGKTITYTKGDGTTGTITTQDTNTTYSTGTATSSGLTKLYTGTGTATDGTMTQAAINTALSGKAAASHGNHVPSTQTANARVFLRNDNTWQTLPSASTSATGIVQLNNAINSTSTTQAATANAAKLAYDKGVEALNKANQAFQSASDGKTKIATAITGKGVAASSSDTFDSLATKINSIKTAKGPAWLSKGNAWVKIEASRSFNYPGTGIVGNKIAYSKGIDTSNTWQSYTSVSIYDIDTNTTSGTLSMTNAGLASSCIGSVDNTNFYLMGGLTSSTTKACNYYYDMSARTWTTKKYPISFGLQKSILVANGTKLYMIGGNSGSALYINYGSTYNIEYETTTDTWTSKAYLPKARSLCGACVYNNKIYIFGGYDNTNQANRDITCYNISTNTYETLPGTLPDSVSLKCRAMAKNGYIYVSGSSTSYGSVGVYKYNITTGEFTFVASKSISDTNVSDLVSEFYNGNFYVLGTSNTYILLI